jgi:hypothetical protein
VCAGLAISAAQARHTLSGMKRFLPDLRIAAAKLSRALGKDAAGPKAGNRRRSPKPGAP